MPTSILLPLLQLAATAAQPVTADMAACAASDVASLGESLVLPETGFAFVIPGRGEDAVEAPPLPPCEPEPVRPRNLDIFGFYALPVTSKAIAARWQDGVLLDLPDGDGNVASLTWGLDKTGANPLDIVNSRVNAEFRYLDDAGSDRWSSARETLARRAGDCEDLAILKLALLARAGVEMDRLFLVVVRDTTRKTDHAVAAVRWENRLWVLDNRLDRIQPAERVMDYVPLQSFSGQWAWTYGYKSGTSAGRAARAIATPQPGR